MMRSWILPVAVRPVWRTGMGVLRVAPSPRVQGGGVGVHGMSRPRARIDVDLRPGARHLYGGGPRNRTMPMNRKHEAEKDSATAYDAFKQFEGRRYTGMKVGGRHKWHYDAGVWQERKMAPDRWEFTYAVPKRRAGKAPPGSGVPVGTEYHWYILAHQHVRKLDANTYTTSMTGMKYKVAHKRADSETWSASEAAQRRALLRILRETIQALEENSAPAAAPVTATQDSKPLTTPARRARPARPSSRDSGARRIRVRTS